MASNNGHAQTGLCDTVTPIRFAGRASSAVVHGAVARGEIACWSFGARAGQKAVLTIDGPGGLAVFQLYRPGWRLVRDDGDFSVVGQAYPGAADGDDAKAWHGVVAQSGSHLVTVGATSGGG